MREVLQNPIFAKLFGAQVIALLGTGLLTVALALLAYDLAGAHAGAVLGIALTIKMVAYVGVSPITTALVARLPRRSVLIVADLLRAVIALSLVFVTEIWQIYLLVFLLQSASATFTPTFQAVIPAVIPDERQYTRALSLSRMAYDFESLVSPIVAAALLTVMSFHTLFLGTVLGFAVSALLVWRTVLPPVIVSASAPFLDRLTRGMRLFVVQRELRAVLLLNLVVAAAASLVIVNTVVLVQRDLGRPQSDVALLLAAYGGGSLLLALWVPRLLDRLSDRRVMLGGAVVLPLLLLLVAGVLWALPAEGPGALGTWIAVLVLWALLGAAVSLVLTPSSRVLRRNSTDENRPALFAAQFALSHACYLLTYPLAGVLGAVIGVPLITVVLAGIGAVGVLGAWRVWRTRAPVAGASADAVRLPIG